MKTYYINFSDDKFEKQQKYLLDKYESYGFIVRGYVVDDIRQLISENKKIFNDERGFGYWIWKPYIILKTMSLMDDNDILLYSDCGDDVLTNPIDFLDNYLKDNDILLVENIFNNRQYTKRDCFYLMDCDDDKYYSANQLEAGIISLKKNNFTYNLMSEWLEYCKNYDIVSDNIKHKDNFSDFIDHRHDQSILTNLCIRNNIKKINIDNMKYFKYGILKK